MTTKSDNRDGSLAKEIRADSSIRELVNLQRETKRNIRVLERELRRDPRLAARDIEERLHTVESRADYIDLLAIDKINRGTLNSFDKFAVDMEFDALKHVIGRQSDRISELREEALEKIRRENSEVLPKGGEASDSLLETDRFKTEIRKMNDAMVVARVRKLQERVIADTRGKHLEANLKGELSLRAGSYRLVYTINEYGKPLFLRFEPRKKVYDA